MARPYPFLNDRHELRNGWRIAAFLGACYVALFLAGGVLAVCGNPAWMGTPWTPFVLTLGVTLLALRLEGRPPASAGLSLDRRALRDGLLGALLGAALITLVALLLWAFGGVRWSLAQASPRLLRDLWLMLGVACFEETFFRGYPFQRLVDGLGLPAGLTLGGLLFAGAHLNNPGMQGMTLWIAFFNITLAGVLLGLCWYRSRGLALPIGFHLTWNWFQGSVFGFGVSGTHTQGMLVPAFKGRPDWLSGGAFGPEASLPCTLVLALAILVLSLRASRVQAD